MPSQSQVVHHCYDRLVVYFATHSAAVPWHKQQYCGDVSCKNRVSLTWVFQALHSPYTGDHDLNIPRHWSSMWVTDRVCDLGLPPYLMLPARAAQLAQLRTAASGGRSGFCLVACHYSPCHAARGSHTLSRDRDAVSPVASSSAEKAKHSRLQPDGYQCWVVVTLRRAIT